MGEQPLFSCKAHVFQLEPEQKKSWIALSTTAVNVQIFHDPLKNIYRIVSIEGTKALINSVVTPRMTFTKTSQKFGQWIDFKLNLVYGLGFANDMELNKFVDKFKEIKELTRSMSFRPHERSNSCEITGVNRQNHEGGEAINTSLKVENERLKMALAQQTQTVKTIEEEMHLFKQTNTRLTNALDENHSSADEWKKQIQYYKEECHRLRNTNTSTKTCNTNGTRKNGHNNNDHHNNFHNNNGDSMEDMSSSSSQNGTTTGNNSTINSKNSDLKFKYELNRLADTFDSKLSELMEVRTQLKNLINEFDQRR